MQLYYNKNLKKKKKEVALRWMLALEGWMKKAEHIPG